MSARERTVGCTSRICTSLSPLLAWIGEVGVLDALRLGTAAGKTQVRHKLTCVRDVLMILRLWSNHGHGDNDGVIMPVDLDGGSLALSQ